MEKNNIKELITKYVNEPCLVCRKIDKGECRCHKPEVAKDIINNAVKMYEEHRLKVCESCGYFNASCGLGCKHHNWYKDICGRCRGKQEEQEHRAEHLKQKEPFRFGKEKEDKTWFESYLTRKYVKNPLSSETKITPEIRKRERERIEYIRCYNEGCKILSQIRSRYYDNK